MRDSIPIQTEWKAFSLEYLQYEHVEWNAQNKFP